MTWFVFRDADGRATVAQHARSDDIVATFESAARANDLADELNAPAAALREPEPA